MVAQFTSKSIDNTFADTETILITREVLSPGFPVVMTTTTIYSGTGDFQNRPASLVYNPSGAVDSAEADIVIDPDANGNLPSVLPNDSLTVAGVAYAVVEATLWSAVPKHLEIVAKRGPLSYGKT